MSGEVVIMPGVVKPSVGAHEQPVETIIDMLCHLRAEAEQGRVRAVAIAFVDDAGCPGTLVSFKAPEGRRNDLIAAVSIMQHELLTMVHDNTPKVAI